MPLPGANEAIEVGDVEISWRFISMFLKEGAWASLFNAPGARVVALCNPFIGLDHVCFYLARCS